MKYYYASPKNELVGPLDLSDLEALLFTGEIKNDTLVSAEFPEVWKPLSTYIQPEHKADSPPEPGAQEIRPIYTKEDAKEIMIEASDSPGWPIFLNSLGFLCMLGSLIVLLAGVFTKDKVNVMILIPLTTSCFLCFFFAHLVDELKRHKVNKRETYPVQMRTALRKNESTTRYYAASEQGCPEE